ncbi:MAG: leucyl/phenylalanyl-tRNA--protein transferase [Actinomycetota bacterium]
MSDEQAWRSSDAHALHSSDAPEELTHESCAVALDLAALEEGLSAESILAAYRRGLLLEHHPDRPGWVNPAKREVIAPQELRLGAPLRRLLREGIFRVSFDEDFAAVLAACEEASPQDSRLAPQLLAAFITLHQEGHAHSIEVRTADGTLAGGLYGIVAGNVFFAEAKFEHVKKASMVALTVLHHHLSHWGFALRSARWGAPVHMVSRDIFRALLDIHAASDCCSGPWTIDPGLDTYAWSGRPRVACRRERNGPLPPLSLTHDKFSASYRQSCAQASGAAQQRA